MILMFRYLNFFGFYILSFGFSNYKPQYYLKFDFYILSLRFSNLKPEYYLHVYSIDERR